MKKMNFSLGKTSLLSFLALAGMSALTVRAEVITLTTSNGLYNTGVEVDDLTPIPGNPSNNPIDPHYTESYYANPGVAIDNPATYTNGYFGNPTSSGSAFVASPTATDSYDPSGAHNWVPLSSTSTSQWITYLPDMGAVENTPSTAVTVYQLVLSGIPAGDVVTLGGKWAADDNLSIYANGTNLFTDYHATDNGTTNDQNYNELNPLSSLVFTSNGEANDLDFVVVNNGGYPTGLNLQLSGSYATAAVPEPSTYALMGVGLLALLIFQRARRAQV